MDYGKAVRIIRSIAGLQQKELARLADVDSSLISLIEKGKRKPGLSTLEKITRALDVPQHLFTLLAAEPHDLKHIRAEEVQRASESLARILLTNAQKPARPKQPRRSRKKAA
jgi:transcriptional regulator with XRE-family HTH domain